MSKNIPCQQYYCKMFHLFSFGSSFAQPQHLLSFLTTITNPPPFPLHIIFVSKLSNSSPPWLPVCCQNSPYVCLCKRHQASPHCASVWVCNCLLQDIAPVICVKSIERLTSHCPAPRLSSANNLLYWYHTICHDGADAQGGGGCRVGTKGRRGAGGNKLQSGSTGNWEKALLFYKSFICHKGIVFSASELFDSFSVRAFFLLLVPLYSTAWCNKINRWRREG